MLLRLSLLLTSLPQSGTQLPDTSLRSRVAAWRAPHEAAIVAELTEFLGIPNLASDSNNIRRNAALIVAMLERRGATARILESPGSPPAVFGELLTPGATRTVVFYAHYDGQPVDLPRWATPPWQVTLRDGASPPGPARSPSLPPASDSTRRRGSTPAPPATTSHRSLPCSPHSTRSRLSASGLR
jgi:hypothetical protein